MNISIITIKMIDFIYPRKFGKLGLVKTMGDKTNVNTVKKYPNGNVWPDLRTRVVR
ncbi:hypothetical protein OKN36_03730 [Furfurilactobacillus sp. OKN36]